MDTVDLEEIASDVLDEAKKVGATSAEINIGTGTGFSVTARLGEVETLEHQNDRSLNITVYSNTRKGSVSSTDFTHQAIKDAVTAAVAIARNSGEDSYAGLIDSKYLASDIPDLDLCHPWDISPEEAIQLTIQCEKIATDLDPRIKNSEGATLNTYCGQHCYGNSNGFIGGWDWSTHSIDCSVIADEDGMMQRDGWYTRCRDPKDLDDIESLAEITARRALQRLGSRKISTCSVPVIYEAPVAGGLFSSFINAISGSSQYRKSSFLLGMAGKKIFPGHISIKEQPHIKKAMGSVPFDSDGMATNDRDLVKEGILQGYVLSAYSARKLGLEPTGNAGGIHNLIIESSNKDLQGLLNEMDKGLLITELIGFGVNQVTGDYSRGASGFWVERGEIQFPVEEITVAGNLTDMFQHICTIGSDTDKRGNIQTGSVLLEGMTIAGN
jgi:PmbA protein